MYLLNTNSFTGSETLVRRCSSQHWLYLSPLSTSTINAGSTVRSLVCNSWLRHYVTSQMWVFVHIYSVLIWLWDRLTIVKSTAINSLKALIHTLSWGGELKRPLMCAWAGILLHGGSYMGAQHVNIRWVPWYPSIVTDINEVAFQRTHAHTFHNGCNGWKQQPQTVY